MWKLKKKKNSWASSYAAPQWSQSSNCSRRKRRLCSHVRCNPWDTPLNLLQAAKQSRRAEQKTMSEHIRRAWRTVRHGLAAIIETQTMSRRSNSKARYNSDNTTKSGNRGAVQHCNTLARDSTGYGWPCRINSRKAAACVGWTHQAV